MEKEKIYIVSAGEYSDWHIKRIFKNKDKAIAYHSTSRDYDLNGIEEYELSDDEIIVPIYYCEIVYNVIDRQGYNKFYPKDKYDFEIKMSNTLEDTEDNINYTYYYNGTLTIRRVINNNFDEDLIRNKYLKVCQDITAQIRDQLSLGVSEYDICKLFDK